VTNVLIDLGEVPKPREQAAPIGMPPFPVRAVLGVLAAVLLVSLAGAAPRARQQPPQIIAARLGDAAFVDGDRLLVVSAGRPVPGRASSLSRTVSTYALPEARLLSRTPVEVSGGVTGVQEVAGVLLLSYQVDASGTWAAVALTAGTDDVRWRHAARLIGMSAADGLVLLQSAGSELAVDLTTGVTRWSLPLPPDGFIAEAGPADGYPRWLVTVTYAGQLESRDARTGRLLGSVTLPRRPGWAGGLVWPVGDLVLVDTYGTGFDAYRLPGLDPAWRTTIDVAQSWMQTDCGALICTFHRQWGMTVLDPADGRRLWTSDLWSYAEPAGRYLLATAHEGVDELPSAVVLDPRTGRQLGDFGSWQALGPAGSGLFYGVRIDGFRILYGTLDPATRQATVLGAGDQVSNDCQTVGAVLLCRLIDASIAVWTLR
jgi:hypothetical protein